MSNVASETLETEQKIGAQTRPKCWLLLLLLNPRNRTENAAQTRPNGAAAAAAAAATAAAAAASAASPAAATGAAGLQNVPFATPKHHGPEGRTSPRSAPKKCLTLLLKP